MPWDDLDADLAGLFGELHDDRADAGAQAVVDRREYLRAAYRERWRTDRTFRNERKRYFRELRLIRSKPMPITEDERQP